MSSWHRRLEQQRVINSLHKLADKAESQGDWLHLAGPADLWFSVSDFRSNILNGQYILSEHDFGIISPIELVNRINNKIKTLMENRDNIIKKIAREP